MSLIKSKQRVVDHGEVFTPEWMVEAMLDLVEGESERIDSRFLEPACGSGNFLVKILQRKLAAVEAKYGKDAFHRRQFAMLSLMCVYGIEILADNVAECSDNLAAVIEDYLGKDEEFLDAARFVFSRNLVLGDALTMKDAEGAPIVFAEWGYLGKGKFQRRDFRLDILTSASDLNADGDLFAGHGMHKLFQPKETFPPMSISDLAGQVQSLVVHPA